MSEVGRNKLGRTKTVIIIKVGTNIVRITSLIPSPYCIPGSGHCSIQRSTNSFQRISANSPSQGIHEDTGRRVRSAIASQARTPTMMWSDPCSKLPACSMKSFAWCQNTIAPGMAALNLSKTFSPDGAFLSELRRLLVRPAATFKPRGSWRSHFPQPRSFLALGKASGSEAPGLVDSAVAAEHPRASRLQCRPGFSSTERGVFFCR